MAPLIKMSITDQIGRMDQFLIAVKQNRIAIRLNFYNAEGNVALNQNAVKSLFWSKN